MSGTQTPRSLGKGYEQMYVRFVIDPLAAPVAQRLARYPAVTPNRITLASGLCGLAAAVCFALGALPAGGLLFLLRFYIDCLDGKVARAQGSSSERGAALDLCMDVTGILFGGAALSWYLVGQDALPAGAALAFVVALGVFNWLLQYRKQLAERHDQGTGGADRSRTTNIPILRDYVRWCHKLDMNPVPYAVEMETLALGLLPLFAAPALAAWGLWMAIAFYTAASAVNFLRIWRIAGRADTPATTLGGNNE